MKILSQNLVPLDMAALSLLQESERGLERMMSQTTLLSLVHYPTKKFEYRNQIETIHIIINGMAIAPNSKNSKGFN